MLSINNISNGEDAAGPAVSACLKRAGLLATGYGPRVNDFLQGAESAFDDEGAPTPTGKESTVQCLYFCGYYVSPKGMLREIAIGAKKISALIKKGYNTGNSESAI